jgi:hypothetical protein
MTYQKREGAKWMYNYNPLNDAQVALMQAAPELLQVAELAAAFVGMHTSGGVPAEYMGHFESLLRDPEAALAEIQSVIDLAKGVR